MAALIVRDFLPRIPQADPKALPDRAAQIATDVDFSDGRLRGLRDVAPVTTVPRAGVIRALHRFGRDHADDTKFWFTSNNDVDYVRNPAANDAQERTYFMGDGTPKVTDATVALAGEPYPAAAYRLGLPNPTAPQLELVENDVVSASYLAMHVTLTTQYKHNLVPGTKVVLVGFAPEKHNTTVTITGVTANSFTYLAPAGTEGAPTTIGTWSVQGATAETRSYVYAWLTAWDELGPPSDPTEITLLPHQLVRVKGLQTAPSGTGPFNVNRKRIYRTIPGRTVTSYFQVAQISSNAAAHLDELGYSSALATVLQSEAWIAPPDEARGLRLMNNGIGVAFDLNTVLVSEAFRLHAYPLAYQKSVDFKIVGVGAFGAYAGVLTQGTPYLLSGTSPKQMSLQPLTDGPACVSKRSIAETTFGVFYAAPNGLALLDRSGARVLTIGTISDEQWRALKPETMHGVFFDGAYIGFYDTGTKRGAIIIVPGEVPAVIDTDVWFEATYVDQARGWLYGIRDGQISRWEGAATRRQFTWRSKTFETPQPVNFAFGRCAAEGEVEMRVYADGVLVHTKEITDKKVFRLPSGFKARDWEIEFVGTGAVIAGGIAHSPKELEGVAP